MTIQELTSKQKAAMLLITLGPAKSSKVFKYLKEEEIEELTLEIANIKAVSAKLKEDVLKEFYDICIAQQYISEGGIGYAKQLLEQSLGQEKASEVINRLTMSLQVRPFEFARKAEASQLVNFIQNEHPQTIAMILSYLKPSQASEILVALPEEMQAETAKRIALMDRASPDVVSDIERELEEKLSGFVSAEYTAIGGIEAIVNIINQVDRSTEKNIMENLLKEEPELAEIIRQRMFVFEDITQLASRDIQRVLREVDNQELAVALKGSNPKVKQVIFSNVSSRLANMLEEDLEYMGPKRLKEIEEAQQNIVNKIRMLEDEGEIIIGNRAGDEIVV